MAPKPSFINILGGGRSRPASSTVEYLWFGLLNSFGRGKRGNCCRSPSKACTVSATATDVRVGILPTKIETCKGWVYHMYGERIP